MVEDKSDFISIKKAFYSKEILEKVCFIPFDIYFKRNHCDYYKKIYLKGSVLGPKKCQKILDNPHRFFIEKNFEGFFSEKKIGLINDLFIDSTFEVRKNNVVKFCRNFFEDDDSIINCLMIFHIIFPLKFKNKIVNEIVVMENELKLFYEFIKLAIHGMGNKKSITLFVENKRKIFFEKLNNKNLSEKSEADKFKITSYSQIMNSFLVYAKDVFEDSMVIDQVFELQQSEVVA